MKNVITVMMFASLVGFGLNAVADDPPASDSSSASSTATSNTTANKKFMHDCMVKAKAANNGMSQQDMKKSCKDQLKTSAGEAKEPVVPQH